MLPLFSVDSTSCSSTGSLSPLSSPRSYVELPRAQAPSRPSILLLLKTTGNVGQRIMSDLMKQYEVVQMDGEEIEFLGGFDVCIADISLEVHHPHVIYIKSTSAPCRRLSSVILSGHSVISFSEDHLKNGRALKIWRKRSN